MIAESESGGAARELKFNFVSPGASFNLPVLHSAKIANKSNSGYALEKPQHIPTTPSPSRFA